MSPDDPRHSTEAGFEQHVRDNEEPCSSCRRGKLLASRRRSKRKTMGYRYTVPIGPLHARLTNWREAGASYSEIADHLGIEESRIWEIIDAGPEAKVYARTYHAIANGPATMPITAIGIVRRVQALAWLGYSPMTIADESGCHVDTITDIRTKGRIFVARKVRNRIAETYDRLHMTVPQPTGRYERAAVTRVRNHARSQGWLPPLAWSAIDDRRDNPQAWEYRPLTRAERSQQLLELDTHATGISEACRRLGVEREALQQWCSRNGMSDLYRRLVTREKYNPNGSIGAA